MSTSKSILLVVTSHDRVDATHRTGVWFDEFAVPYQMFQAQGLDITVASPLGGSVPLDPRSEPKGDDIEKMAAERAVLQQTIALSEVSADQFDAVYIPGGHGAMFDLSEDATLESLLGDFARQDKVIASVCHGLAGLVKARRTDGMPLVAGKTITSFTNNEEYSGGLDSLMPFLLETRLRELGANFVVQPKWSDHIECDGKLITGQNPQSSRSAARAIIEALQA
jgi:putative intracellular protease/amidase